MARLIEEEVTVRDYSGRATRATMPVCACGERLWYVYIIRGGHLHFQCGACAESYCDGKCAGPAQKGKR